MQSQPIDLAAHYQSLALPEEVNPMPNLSANDQIAEWLNTANKDELTTLINHIMDADVIAAVLVYQYITLNRK
jgi:hypothetical protein